MMSVRSKPHQIWLRLTHKKTALNGSFSNLVDKNKLA